MAQTLNQQIDELIPKLRELFQGLEWGKDVYGHIFAALLPETAPKDNPFCTKLQLKADPLTGALIDQNTSTTPERKLAVRCFNVVALATYISKQLENFEPENKSKPESPLEISLPQDLNALEKLLLGKIAELKQFNQEFSDYVSSAKKDKTLTGIAVCIEQLKSLLTPLSKDLSSYRFEGDTREALHLESLRTLEGLLTPTKNNLTDYQSFQKQLSLSFYFLLLSSLHSKKCLDLVCRY